MKVSVNASSVPTRKRRTSRIKKIIYKSSESGIKSALEKARKQKKEWQVDLPTLWYLSR